MKMNWPFQEPECKKQCENVFTKKCVPHVERKCEKKEDRVCKTIDEER